MLRVLLNQAQKLAGTSSLTGSVGWDHHVCRCLSTSRHMRSDSAPDQNQAHKSTENPGKQKIRLQSKDDDAILMEAKMLYKQLSSAPQQDTSNNDNEYWKNDNADTLKHQDDSLRKQTAWSDQQLEKRGLRAREKKALDDVLKDSDPQPSKAERRIESRSSPVRRNDADDSNWKKGHGKSGRYVDQEDIARKPRRKEIGGTQSNWRKLHDSKARDPGQENRALRTGDRDEQMTSRRASADRKEKENWKQSNWSSPQEDRISSETSGKKWHDDDNISEDWADTFGTLAAESEEDLSGFYPDMTEGNVSDTEEDTEKHHYRLSTTDRRHPSVWYGRKMKKLEKAGKVKDAIAVLDTWMLKEDRVMPTQFEFNTLIGICGRVGYTKKAFQLFNQMKKMGVKPRPHTYSALFNACANSPWPEDGLSRARKLESLMEQINYPPNFFTIKIMIKAFGVCGDIEKAFSLVDDAISKYRYRITPDYLDALLMACVSDKEAGFRQAILTWRLMKRKGIKPELSSYRHLLRCVRDCGMGDPAQLYLTSGNRQASIDGAGNTAIKSSQRDTGLPFLGSSREVDCGRLVDEHVVRSESGDGSRTVFTHSGLAYPASIDNNFSLKGELAVNVRPTSEGEGPIGQKARLPSLLSSNEGLEEVTSLGKIASAGDRLNLLGGVHGLIKSMQTDGVAPDVVLFSELLMSVSPEQEGELLEIVKNSEVEIDIDFYNDLIWKRCSRKDYQAARDVLPVIREKKLTPNQRTYGCLAYSCTTKTQGLQLLQDMQEAGLSPNIKVIGSLMRRSWLNFSYKLKLLLHMKELQIGPDQKMIEDIEEDIENARRALAKKEKKLDVPHIVKFDNFEADFNLFLRHYEMWSKRTSVSKPDHPWKPFRQEKP